jgi:membrane protein implicated in regulation of membrane protease activity
MQTVIDLYTDQPFWMWLALGVILLAIEAALSTEWLLWPAVSAGVVAVLTAVGLRMGLPVEIAVFAVLTIVSSVASRRLVKRVNPSEPDINDRDSRLIGQRARVVEAFVNGRGRVFISGSEWPAEGRGDMPGVGEWVLVQATTGSGLIVEPL